MRPRRILYADRYAHVFTHAVDGITFTEKDLRAFVQTLRTLVGNHPIHIKYYAITPTHMHLIIQFEEEISCGWVMQNLNGELGKTYNRLYGRRGHMWRERYKDVTIETDAHFATSLAYVALNNLKYGAVDSLDEDIFSSYPVYAYGHDDGITEIYEGYLEKGDTPEERQAEFRATMAACARIMKDVQRGRREEALEARAREAGIRFDELLSLCEFEERHLIKDALQAPEILKTLLFTRAALEGKRGAQSHQAPWRHGTGRLPKRHRPRAVLNLFGLRFYSTEAFMWAFVREYCPWIDLDAILPAIPASPGAPVTT